VSDTPETPEKKHREELEVQIKSSMNKRNNDSLYRQKKGHHANENNKE
jgi:hypothetical protein